MVVCIVRCDALRHCPVESPLTLPLRGKWVSTFSTLRLLNSQHSATELTALVQVIGVSEKTSPFPASIGQQTQP
jgi:hypothetical protein